MSDERKKLSWREIDKLKDSSGLSKLRKKMEQSRSHRSVEDKKSKERYLKELDKLFTGKEVSEKEEYLKKLHLSVGRRDFQKMLHDFYQRFGLPDEPRDLLLFLDAGEREIFFGACEKIRENFGNFSLSEKQSLIAKLKSLKLSLRDETLSYKVEKLLKELSL
ncbi:hypothetical protein THC_1645 [Caldimicrobium thiodismutans]|jgi:hypothetical protein|uniref:Uncharacterized protein n=1 Tax=Caldimicrobium thiodismutans TaxID=1653476 RepID=A0A0U5BYW5_9BACT|nr:hypothetical protein [Caldimicrobium thiodismutans]BAU24005.1 hypothetical protein THC_1645 [Caldimicrobium thiodismutans]